MPHADPQVADRHDRTEARCSRRARKLKRCVCPVSGPGATGGGVAPGAAAEEDVRANTAAGQGRRARRLLTSVSTAQIAD